MTIRGKALTYKALALASTLALSACGGGGGGGGNTAPSTAMVSVSGTVSVGTGGAAAKANASGVVAKASLTDAAVVITSFNTAGTQLDKQTIATNQAGLYSTNDLVLSTSGGYVVITVTKQGFADYSKRIDYTSAANLNLNAELLRVQTVVASVGTIMTAAGGREPGFSFGVVRYADGTRKAMSGNSLALAKAAGATSDLEINIPANSVPAGTSTLVGSFNTFDSSNPDEAKSFPGDYVDKDGNRLVSLAFDYMNITDDQGQNLGQLVKAARASGNLAAAATSDTIINRYIPSGSAENLLKDFCDGTAADHSLCSALSTNDKTGFNVPIYTYRSATGDWELLGMGTVDVDNNGVIDTNDTQDNGVPRTAQQYRDLAATGRTYLKILVTNEAFIQSWWNLDYPLVFNQAPKQLCLNGTVKDNNGQPIVGMYLSLYDDDTSQSFGYGYAVTDANGKYQLKTTLTDASSDRTASLYYSDPYSYASANTTATLGESPSCGTKDITITKPQMGKIKGRLLTAANQALANQYIYAWEVNTGGYSQAYTDSTGRFELEVRVNESVAIYTGYNNAPTATANVNGTVDGSEKSDSAQVAELYDMQLANRNPYAYGYLSANTIKTDGMAKVYVYGYDEDGNYPLSYTVSSTNTAWVEKTGTLSANAGWVEIPVSGLAIGSYPLTLVVTDAVVTSGTVKKGRTTVNIGTLEVTAAANRAPTISYAYLSAGAVAPSGVVTVTASGYDLDGNPLTWKVMASVNGATAQQVCAGDSGSTASVTIACEYTAPPSSGNVTLTVELSDGSLTQSRTMNLSVGTLAEFNVIIQ